MRVRFRRIDTSRFCRGNGVEQGDFFQLSTEKEKFIRRYEIAFYKIKFYNLDLDIVHTMMGTLGEKYKIIDQKYNSEKAFIIDDEKQFVMSLCKISNIIILESKTSNNLLTAKEKEKYKGNYIVINEFID